MAVLKALCFQWFSGGLMGGAYFSKWFMKKRSKLSWKKVNIV
jgi:hypothetical protein